MDVGFLGLGRMGSAVAANLLRAGHRVHVWNRSPQPLDALVALGAIRAESPMQAFGQFVVFSMLADDAAVHSVISDQVFNLAVPEAIHVNLSTISIELTRELHHRHRYAGQYYVAAPVFGRPDIAAAGQLNIVAAGDADAIASVQPLFDVMGQRTWRLGTEPERAITVKLAGNLMIASAIEAMAESAALVQKHGIPSRMFFEIMTDTLSAAPVYKNCAAMIAEKNYEPAAFKLRLGLKDVNLMLAAGHAVSIPLPFASVVRDNLLDAMAHGEGELDFSAIANVVLRRSNQKWQPQMTER